SADPDVPDALGCWTPDHFPRTHPWSVLVDTARSDPPAGRARDAGAGDPDRRVRGLHDTPRLEVCSPGLGLCAGVVPPHRPGEAARLPDPRSGHDRGTVRYGA